MAERIDVPPTLQGDEKAQLQQVWSYLYQLSEAINNNLDGIGGNELTDSERQTMQMILSAGDKAPELSEMETLKSLIIKTADFVQTSLQEYRMSLLGETVASGKFGRYVRSTGLDVAVTPEGITQNYSFQEIIQGLKVYEINAKNYIKTGLLRTVSSIPVYGVAIGKDVVTFSEDGTETYNDGNKVAELTADELSFWQNGVKVAGYTGTRISFYYNNAEVMYIQNGIIHVTGDFKIDAGGSFDLNSNNTIIDSFRGVFANKTRYSGWQDNILFTSSFGDLPNNLKGDIHFFIMPVNERHSYNGQVVAYTYHGKLEIDDDKSEPGYSRNTTMKIGTGYSAISQKYYPHIDIEGFKRANNESSDTSDCVEFDIQGNLSIYHNYSRGNGGYFRCYDMYALTIGAGTVTATEYITTSSRDIKHDIRMLESSGSKIDALRPVTFVYDSDEKEKKHAGLIYEEAIEVMPEICTGDENHKAINYVELIPVLLKEIQELRARVAELERRL